MGHIEDLLAPTEQDEYSNSETKKTKRILIEMPVIIMGEYSARGSDGHVVVYSRESWNESPDGYRKVLVVGGLGPNFGKKALRVLGNPIPATLVRGPVEIEELANSGNSNCASAAAAWAGVKLLSSVDPRSVFLVEGQSDYTYVLRLRSVATEGVTEFPREHHEEMFSRENIVRRMVFSSAYHGIVRSHDHDGYKPSKDEVKAAAKGNVKAYLEAKSENRDRCWELLGHRFGLVNLGGNVIEAIAEELGVNIAE